MTDNFDIRNSAFGPRRLDPFDIRNSAFGIPPVPPFNDSDCFRTAMREAQNPKQGRLTCRVWEDKDDDVRWQWREATWTTIGSPKGERDQAHQYPSPQRGNANFAWVQHFIHHLVPQGVAGFGLVRFWCCVKLRAARVFEPRACSRV